MNTITPPTTLGWYAVRCTTERGSIVHAVFPSIRDAEDWGHEHRGEFPDSASVEIVEIVKPLGNAATEIQRAHDNQARCPWGPY